MTDKKMTNYEDFVEKKIKFFNDLIVNTSKSAKIYKMLDLINPSDLISCNNLLEKCYEELNSIVVGDEINSLQKINDKLSDVIKLYGTYNISDLIDVVIGKQFLKEYTNCSKYNCIHKNYHPIGYKILKWKRNNHKKKNTTPCIKNKIVEDFYIVENSENFECFDLARTSIDFHKRVYGVKMSIQDIDKKQTIIISGIVDDINLKISNDDYCCNYINLLKKNNNDPLYQTPDYIRFIESLTVKDYLVYSIDELQHRYVGYTNKLHLMSSKNLSDLVKDFINDDLYTQRTTLIQLLIKIDSSDCKFIACMLYDLLSNDENGRIDTYDQTLLYDSLPWNIKKHFKTALITCRKKSEKLYNSNESKISLEQQISLLKVSDEIKEKAFQKLKEVKGKSDDSSSKARIYLEGLLKIPFGKVIKEPILTTYDEIKEYYNSFINEYDINRDNINTVTICDFCINFERYIKTIIKKKKSELLNVVNTGSKADIVDLVEKINLSLQKKHINKIQSKKILQKLLRSFISDSNQQFYSSFYENIDISIKNHSNIQKKFFELRNQTCDIINKFDKAVHGHKPAKRILQRIIGQWIVGDNEGYCIGFEGPPGVGKTSLAKYGISNCLSDEEGNPRPFHLIALGGSSNASTLDGHNYTYLGSTWGKIVDILMKSKCMNPIIFIDELDKVSCTEHGKEIVGILTHLVDSTQNDSFQDRYFSGINIDLSKVLFIFSYNDPSKIDPILLDRIHRVKFKSLTVDEKITISKNYILKELHEKFSSCESINISNEVLKYIIKQYTCESGVRKLKQHLFDIISEINLEILSSDNINNTKNITIDMVNNIYLKNAHKIIPTKIMKNNTIGTIQGLWANSIGQGGITMIETNWFPLPNFLDYKLTGLQGDVMKESMQVAKTLAWTLTSEKLKKELLDNKMGFHIHCPSGATPKDGPSAGTAITIALFSLLNKLPISNKYAITGEINLRGDVTEIGGLDLKILGGIEAGVTHFIFPEKNETHYKKFLEIHQQNISSSIKFSMVNNIKEVIDIIFPSTNVKYPINL